MGKKLDKNWIKKEILLLFAIDKVGRYKARIEQLQEKMKEKDAQIEKMNAEKEEFSLFLIRDLLTAQKQAEERRQEVLSYNITDSSPSSSLRHHCITSSMRIAASSLCHHCAIVITSS